MGVLCRDCLGEAAGLTCHHCGSARLIDHPERHDLAVAHLDCDAFYASIEKRDDPALVDKPLIVGGGKRGVVSTCCYIARRYGVHSAMPMFKALKACPHAVVIKPNMEKYVRVGRQIRDMMRDLTPMVEPLSIDEAFLDLNGTERLHGASPALTLARFQQRVAREVGVTVSIGLSHNKFLAKIASDLDKPNGFSIIGRSETASFLADKPLSIIFGVGKVAQRRYERDGLMTIADIRVLGAAEMARRYGGEGERLHRLANGIDRRAVQPEREAKSISAETTFEHDLSAFADLEPILWRLAEKVADRLRRAGLAGASVTLKMKTSDFQIRTRTRPLPPTQLAAKLFETAADLLRRETPAPRLRLIGIGIAAFSPADTADKGDLLDQRSVREAKAEQALFALRDRFGSGSIGRGITLRKPG